MNRTTPRLYDVSPFFGRALMVLTMVSCFAVVGCSDDEPSKDDRWKLNEGQDAGIDASDYLETGVDQPPPDATSPDWAVATTVQTRLTTPNPARAGTHVGVECLFYDQYGEEFYFEEAPTTRLNLDPETSFGRNSDNQRIAVRAGDATIACVAPSLGLVDRDPVELAIVAGDPDTVTTTLDRNVITAGEQVQASCEAFDAFGNRIMDAQPRLESDISGAAIVIDGLEATITGAAVYLLSCHIDGAPNVVGDYVEVRPDLPANLLISRVPDQNVYSIGQVITIASVVTDRFGNPVPQAQVRVVSEPDGESFGNGRFRYHQEGFYILTATVEGPTLDDIELMAQVEVIINSEGPEIHCEYPFDGQMIDVNPGSEITFRGTVADSHGINLVSIGDQSLSLDGQGGYSHPLTVRFGINFVNIMAEDGYGEQSVRTCAFLASNRWVTPAQPMNDSVTLRLSQNAIDDGTTTGPIRSLTDILRAVLNSDGLHATLHAALLAANPLKPMSCDQQACLFGACTCLFRSQVDYLQSYINGPNTASMQLVNGGLRIIATIRNIGMQVRVTGTLSNTGWVTMSYVTVDLTSNLTLVNGRPHVSLRQINNVDVGQVSLNFSGFSGLIIDILQALFQGQIRNMVRDLISGYVNTSFNEALDGVVGSLDVSTIGSTFSVPKLDGSGTISLALGVNFSSLLTNTARALFGLEVNFTAPPGHAIPTLGAAYPAGTVRLDPVTPRNTAAAVHIGVINQALHALWVGGFFHADLGEDLFGDSLEGASVRINAALPPVAEYSEGGKIDLMLGALNIELMYPGLFDDPIAINIGASAQTGISLVGDDLSFFDIQLTEFYFSPVDIAINPEARRVLDGFLRGVVQSLLLESLNSALPALPIPSFELPASMGTYGLPVGAELGITQPVLSHGPRHVILEGTFGIR